MSQADQSAGALSAARIGDRDRVPPTARTVTGRMPIRCALAATITSTPSAPRMPLATRSSS
jgi:hypothetical protein